mmetsp:Transcript_7591/g.12790  ORF Transcript_7591/g.12790 Transcript_7591/m.12790 type:complete len:243 (+) Transcript_7591:132-860(+)
MFTVMSHRRLLVLVRTIKRKSSSQHQWRRPVNQNTIIYGIVGANIAVFTGWQMAEKDYQLRNLMTRHFTVSSRGVFRYHDYHTLLTATFSHKDSMHLLFNMVAFYSFGVNCIPVLGAARFSSLYFGGGLLSSLAQVCWPYVIPKSWPAYLQYSYYSVGLGASGAVNAVVAWNILKYPTSMIYLYGILPMPAAVMGLAFLGIDAYSLYRGDGTIGNAAHLAGSFYGAAFFAMTRGRIQSFRRF